MSETVWTDEMLVNMLKEDLGRRNPSEATLTYFNMLISTAKKEIGRERVAIPEQITDPADVHLVVTYASWLYRKRAATGEDSHMPRSLRYLLNNRAFSNQEVTTDAGTDG